MELTEHLNANNVAIKLPSLPEGYSWKIRPVRPLHTVDGVLVLNVQLSLELYKTVPLNELELFLKSFGRDKENRAKEMVISYSVLPDVNSFDSLDEAHSNITLVAEGIFKKAFPQKLSVYAGTYSAPSN